MVKTKENTIGEFLNECAGTTDPNAIGSATLHLVRKEDIENILLNMDDENSMLYIMALRGVAETIKRVQHARRGEGPLCASCDFEFTKPTIIEDLAAITVLVPRTKDPHNALMSGVCKTCASQPDDIVLLRAAEKMAEAGIGSIIPPSLGKTK